MYAAITNNDFELYKKSCHSSDMIQKCDERSFCSKLSLVIDKPKFSAYLINIRKPHWKFMFLRYFHVYNIKICKFILSQIDLDISFIINKGYIRVSLYKVDHNLAYLIYRENTPEYIDIFEKDTIENCYLNRLLRENEHTPKLLSCVRWIVRQLQKRNINDISIYVLNIVHQVEYPFYYIINIVTKMIDSPMFDLNIFTIYFKEFLF